MLLSLMLYLVQITWRFSDLDRLTSVLDFILDGLEESIRDIMEFLLEEDGEKKFIAKPISRCNSDDRLIATQIDMDDIRNDLIDTVDEKIVKATEKNLWDQLIEYHKEKKVCTKYRKFRLLLEHFSTSNTIRHAYMMRRTMLVMLNLISKLIIWKSNLIKFIPGVYTLYTLYIDPTKNPSRIECMLPQGKGNTIHEFEFTAEKVIPSTELQYSTLINDEPVEVTTMTVYYTAANIRFFIVALTIVLQLVLIIFAILTWGAKYTQKSKG